jgi:hypothetical protein
MSSRPRLRIDAAGGRAKTQAELAAEQLIRSYELRIERARETMWAAINQFVITALTIAGIFGLSLGGVIYLASLLNI